MRENYRNSIASIKKFPQFTTMHVIDGQAGLIICASLIFCSLTIDNILNIIVLLILAGISISMLSGDNSILSKVAQVREDSIITQENEQIKLAVNSSRIDELGEKANAKGVRKYFKSQGDKVSVYQNEDEIEIEYLDTGHKYIVKANGEIVKQEGTDTEEKKVYYKIDGTTLYLSSIKKDDNYKEIEDYYYTNNNDYKFPKWVGDITINEEGNGIIPISSIEKVIIENRIQPKNTSFWFFQCKNLNKIENIGRIDTRDSTNMKYMFSNCTSLTSLDVSNFNTSKVTNMSTIFYNCTSLTLLDVSNFDTSSVTNMACMFYNCKGLATLDVSNFNTSKVLNMEAMFYSCRGLTSLDVSNFDTSNVTNMGSMFQNCTSLNLLDVCNFNTSNVTNMIGMFENCTSLSTLDVSNFNTSKVTNMAYMFAGSSSSYKMNFTEIKGLDKFDTSNVTDMNTMFQWCYKMTTIDVSHFDTSKVTNLDSMFWQCQGLTSINLTNFDTSSVTIIANMFYNCKGLTSLDLSSFDTNRVTETEKLFYNCTKLNTIYVNTLKLNMSNVTNSKNMFYGCKAIEGSNGTKYDSSKIDVSMAHVDVEGNPGYFSTK